MRFSQNVDIKPQNLLVSHKTKSENFYNLRQVIYDLLFANWHFRYVHDMLSLQGLHDR